MIFTRRFLKISVGIIIALTVLNFIYLYKNRSRINDVVPKAVVADYSINNEKISWEDENWINYEKTRVGPGEHGEAWIETDPEMMKKNEESKVKEGFYVEVSNKISFTRALPDQRLEKCRGLKYYKKLPKVSVIITFHNEIHSTLLRCIHSVYNRSPKELLHEIVLINDNSTFPELYDQLRTYVKTVFGSKVKLYENEERQGLIKARMTGAKKATGEVIIFLDSHMEVYNSWLPPLLDVIVDNPTFAAVPIVDGMDHKTFKPTHTGNGYRGMFDWNFRYQWLPLRAQDKIIEGQPYELPCMTGGAYAIRRDHFFHLGGYDEGLLIWNGENYEMCLKLWLCSGGLFEVPCSRVVHLSKVHSAYRKTEEPMDFIGRNLKRVAEVWLDDYKQYFYRGDQKRYDKIDPGDLTEQFKKKKELNCKPFSYYLEVVAPDMLMRYPIIPQYFAAGQIRSLADTRCLGMPSRYIDPVKLIDCNTKYGIDFILSLERSIKLNDTNDQCLSSNRLNFANCHHQFSDHYWKFDLDSRQISNPPTKRCLTANKTEGSITMLPCELNVQEQKWSWSYENKTALMNWEKTGIPVG